MLVITGAVRACTGLLLDKEMSSRFGAAKPLQGCHLDVLGVRGRLPLLVAAICLHIWIQPPAVRALQLQTSSVDRNSV